ncbi:MAG: hypothetical protein E3K37_03470 [Candidatus Kuenenia sp.]|nr:hypothetical protein [Candidatus Kuenenia hertensis]
MEPFTDLVLLIGTNPLPNFVVAEYFLKDNNALQNIWLIHSEEAVSIRQLGTGVQAENLEIILQTRHNGKGKLSFPLKKVSLSNASNAQSILNDIKEKFIKKLTNNCSVHLNYTGGTKAMGTHVYRAIEQVENIKKSFSYLDGRNFQIISDENGIINQNDLRSEVQITFEELIKLHGFKRKNTDDNHDFSEAVCKFRKLIDEGRLDEYFQTDGGYNRNLFENIKKVGELATKINELKCELKNYTAKGALLSIAQSMPEGYQIFNDKGEFLAPQTKNICKYAIRFLDGTWLEEYVYVILGEVLRDDTSIKIEKNWVIDKKGWTTDFEIDVPVLKGYQLIGISCTTSDDKYICKSKGFEIIHRTKQIGGDEAKAILITRANVTKRDNLQKELEINTGITSGNILVLGENDLKSNTLREYIASFIHQD